MTSDSTGNQWVSASHASDYLARADAIPWAARPSCLAKW